jgi:hypothetical protein
LPPAESSSAAQQLQDVNEDIYFSGPKWSPHLVRFRTISYVYISSPPCFFFSFFLIFKLEAFMFVKWCAQKLLLWKQQCVCWIFLKGNHLHVLCTSNVDFGHQLLYMCSWECCVLKRKKSYLSFLYIIILTFCSIYYFSLTFILLVIRHFWKKVFIPSHGNLNLFWNPSCDHSLSQSLGFSSCFFHYQTKKDSGDNFYLIGLSWRSTLFLFASSEAGAQTLMERTEPDTSKSIKIFMTFPPPSVRLSGEALHLPTGPP